LATRHLFLESAAYKLSAVFCKIAFL
jgi:hypothetical protein